MMKKIKPIKKDPNSKILTAKDDHESGIQKGKSSLPQENPFQMLLKPK